MSSYYKNRTAARELELKLLIEAIRKAEAGNDYGHKNYYAKILTKKLAYYGYVILDDYTIHPSAPYDRLDRDKAIIKDLEEQLQATRNLKVS